MNANSVSLGFSTITVTSNSASFTNVTGSADASINLVNGGLSSNGDLLLKSLSADAGSNISALNTVTIDQTVDIAAPSPSGISTLTLNPGAVANIGDNVGGTGLNSLILNGNSEITFHQTTGGNGNFMPGVISGSGTLNVDGGGTLSFNQAATYTGLTTIASGTTLRVTNLAGDVTDNGHLEFFQGGPFTYPGNLTGSGDVTIGFVDITFSGTNNYTGGTTVTGILRGTTSSLPGDFLINGGLIFDQGFAGTHTGTLTGGGQLELDAGDVTLAGTSNYTGGTVIVGGTLIGDTGSLQGNIDNGSALVFSQPGTGTFVGSITDVGTVTVDGQGTGNVTFQNANSYGGGTTIQNGTLTVLDDSRLGALAGGLTFNNGTLAYQTTLDTSRAVNLVADGTFQVPGANVVGLLGNITGTGRLVKTGTGTLRLDGSNSYGGGTLVSQGTLQGTTTSLQGAIVDNAALVFNQNFAGTYAGNLSGTGSVLIDGGGTVTFSGTNNYSGGTTIQNNSTLQGTTTSLQGNILDNAHLIFNQGDSGTYAGNISGTGNVVISGGGVVTFTGTNNYNGGTTIQNASTLVGNTTSLQGSIVDNAGSTLQFNQTTNGTFSGAITGSGNLVKSGAGTLFFNTSQAGFAGATSVIDGTLSLNATLGGNVSVTNSGTLTGTGTVSGNLGVSNGGILFLTAPTDTFNVGGSYTQGTGGTYRTTINGLGQSSLLNVAGNLNLSGDTTLLIDSADGNYSSSFTYHVAHAGLVNGTYAHVLAVNPIFTPQASYTATDIFINFSGSFLNIAQTFNEQQVANQLNGLTSPTPAQQAILDALASIPTADAILALNQMTGQQYAAALFTAELENEQFLRQLYNPLRPMIGDPCAANRCGCGWQGWVQATGGHGHFDGNHDASPISLNDYSVAAGAGKRVSQAWFVGGALSYAREDLSYKVIGGSGTSNSFLGGLYGLYRPSSYYAFGDIALGYNHHQVRRQIDIGDLHFQPRGTADIFQGTAYVEAGKDFLFPCLLAQPFVGIEGGYYTHGNFSEETGTPLDLSVEGRGYGAVYSRLGLHFATPRMGSDIYVGADCAWQYRLTSVKNHTQEHFNDFGTEFPIHGFNLMRNMFDGDLFIAKALGRGDVFAQGGLQIGNNATCYEVTVGFSTAW